MAAHGCSYLIQNTASCSLQGCDGICNPPISPGHSAAVDYSLMTAFSHKRLLVITHRSQPSLMEKWPSNSNQTWSHILSSVTGKKIFIMSLSPLWIISFLFRLSPWMIFYSPFSKHYSLTWLLYSLGFSGFSGFLISEYELLPLKNREVMLVYRMLLLITTQMLLKVAWQLSFISVSTLYIMQL